MPTTEEKKDDRAERQARSGVEHIVAIMRRLKHAQECDGEDCDELTDIEINEALDRFSKDLVTQSDRYEYHDEDQARERVEESHYGVSVRGQWATPGDTETLADPIEYDITLSGGGPATRIYGELGEHNYPETADMQYQDWFTPWETLYIESDEERELLLEYARQMYFGD